MKILIACEESQAVTTAFRNHGAEAYSCDILPCSGGHPEWHIQGDAIPLLSEHWDMVVAFPPCTHLACSGARWFFDKKKDGRQQQGINFFLQFTKLACPWAIENPIGIMSRIYRKPDQIIQPFMFGDKASKKTCLWLSGLPKLNPTEVVGRGEHVEFESGRRMPKWYAESWRLSKEERARLRSRTFAGIAKAMADQWTA